jgi:radical SAM protein with 4Fe4S-binding SPASM domain
MARDAMFGRYYRKCYGQQFATVITASGKMYICCHLRGYEKYCIGDLNKDSFKKIWHSKRRKEVVEKIDFSDCIPLCRDNTFNQILWNIKQPREHVNFL